MYFVSMVIGTFALERKENRMKQFWAWVFFVIGVINLGSNTYHVAVSPPQSSGTILHFLSDPTPINALCVLVSLLMVSIVGLCFYLWWKWK